MNDFILCSAQSVKEAGCAPPMEIDPRTHLNGPFISIRKVQKQQELCRLQALEVRLLLDKQFTEY